MGTAAVDPTSAALDLSGNRAPGVRLLVVCTGNLCRSPMAVAVLRDRFRRAGVKVSVSSAGTAVRSGHAPVETVAELLAERGLSAAAEEPRPVSVDDLRRADLVLVMEEAHRRTLYQRLPAALPRILLLGELDGAGDEIPDPHRRGRAAHRAALHRIEGAVDDGWERLLQRLGLGTS